MSDQKMFWGTGVALITPFKDQRIDYDAFAEIIEHVIDGGVDYLVPLGTTGEAVTLTTEECNKVIRFTVERAKDRLPVVGGLFGSNNTGGLIRYLNQFNTQGLAAILSSSPSYLKPTQEGIYRHYTALANASTLPIILYNVPGRTSSNLAADTILKLANHPFIVAVKEASANFDQIQQLTKHAPDTFSVLSGDDPTTLATIAVGGKGVISVIANAFPNQFSTMIRLALQEKFTQARALNQQLQDLHHWLYIEGNPVGIKGAMQYLGFCSREVRLPLAPLSDQNYQNLSQAIQAAGI